jgi:hypothetical protein
MNCDRRLKYLKKNIFAGKNITAAKPKASTSLIPKTSNAHDLQLPSSTSHPHYLSS